MQNERRDESILARLFGIDPRGLAFFRMALASCVLFDLVQRSVDLYAHYTDAGVLSRADALRLFAGALEWPFCLHMISGALEIQAVLFLLHAAAAVALLLGYRTRAAAFVVWLLLASVQLRNLLIVGDDDTLLRMYALWGIFLPLGSRVSLDNVRHSRTTPAPASMVLSVGSVALLAQVMIVYWAAGYGKVSQDIWLDGSALSAVLHDRFLATPLGRALLEWPTLCALLSRATVAFELGGPPLLILSGLYPGLRIAVIAALCAMNLSVGLTLDVGLFPWLMAIGTLPFLPPELWDRVAAWGVLQRLRARALAQPASRWVLQRAKGSGAPAPPSVDGVGKRLVDGLCALLLVVVAICNAGVARDPEYIPPRQAQWIVGSLFLQQDWRMFAEPAARTGWVVIHARLMDGRDLDLTAARGRAPSLSDYDVGAAVDFDTPRGVEAFANRRWRTLLRRVVSGSERNAIARLYGRYLCREWNRRYAGDDALGGFHIVYVSAELRPPYDEKEYQSGVVWGHDCFG